MSAGRIPGSTERGVAHDREAIGHLARGCIVRAVRDRLVRRGRAARRPGEGAGLEEVRGPAERVPGDAVGLVDRLRQLRGRARERRRRSITCSHYEGLEGGNSLFAHVHFGQRSVGGGVSFFLCGGGTQADACPNVEGTFEGDVTPADVVGPNGQGIEPMSFGEIIRAHAGRSQLREHPHDALARRRDPRARSTTRIRRSSTSSRRSGAGSAA